MANQPKKYKKFVATAATATLVASAIVPVASAASLSDIAGNTHEEAINALVSDGIISGYQDGTFKPNKELTRSDVVKLLGKFLETKGYEAAADYKTRPAFADLTTKTNEELLKYASLVKEAGVFVGSNGNLLAGDPITRENMAITLVRTVNTVYDVSLEEFVSAQDFKGDVSDLNQAKAEARTAISVLDFYDITNPAAPAFNPKGNTTRGQFASFLFKTINADYTAAGQEDEEVSAVLPTAIAFEESSIQGSFGVTVTLKAKVTVATGDSAANIPVKFDIFHEKLANDTTIVPQITDTVKTDENGVATYTYTRSQGEVDTVNAYATGKPALKAAAKVYWNTSLAVEEITAGNQLANNTKKSYKVKGAKNATYYVAIKENLDINPDQITRVMVQDGSNIANPFKTPYELKNGTTEFAKVETNNNGEGTFTIYGTNLTATPIVYKAEGTTNHYTTTALQASAPTVKFSQADVLKLDVKAEGNADAARYAQTPVKYNDNSVGGRAYTVTVTDKDGKVAPAGTVAYVTFKTSGMSSSTSDNLYFSTDKADFTKVSANQVFSVVVGKEGKAQFRIAGNGPTVFAKPTVFLNTAGDLSPAKLDTTDVQLDAETTYFKDAVVANAVLTVKDGVGANARVITSLPANKEAYFEYQSVDQNGFAYRPTRVTAQASTITVFEPVYAADGVTVLYYQQRVISNPASIANNFALAFDVTSSFGNTVVKDLSGTVLNATQNLGNVKTYILTSDNNGKAVIRVTSTTPGDVSVNVTGSGHILPTATAKVTFTSGVAPVGVSGKVFALNTTDKTFAVLTAQGGTGFYEYEGAELKYNGTAITEADFEAYLAAGATITVTETADGVKTFNIVNVGTPISPSERTLDVAVDYLVAEATSNGATSLVIDNATLNSVFGTAPTASNVTIDTVSRIAIELASDVTIGGDLTVNAPNADVTNSGTVTGNVFINDVSSNSFVNEGTIGGKVEITDTTGARFVNNGTITTGLVEINTTGAVKLEGTNSYNLVVKQAAAITLATGFAPTSIKTEGEGAKATIGGAVLNKLVAVAGTTTTSDSVEITFSENVAGGNIAIDLNGTPGTVSAGSALNKLVATFGATLTSTDTVTVTVNTAATSTTPASTSTFEFTSKDGITWTRKNQ